MARDKRNNIIFKYLRTRYTRASKTQRELGEKKKACRAANGATIRYFAVRSDASAAAEFLFVLLPETVSHGEEVPTPLLVHVPHVGLLTRVLRVRFVDQVHEEEPVYNSRTRVRLTREPGSGDGPPQGVPWDWEWE